MHVRRVSGLVLAAVSVVVSLAGCLGDGTRVYRLSLAQDPAFLLATNIPERFRQEVPASAESRTLVPASADDSPLNRVVVVFGPNGDNSTAMEMWNPFRDTLGAAIISVNIRRADSPPWGQYYFVLHLLRDLKTNGVLTPDANIVLAGYSGGAEAALGVGNFGGTRQFDAILAVGVKQSTASAARDALPNQDALRLPITILNGDGDQVTRRSEDVMQDLHEAGFSRARLVEYAGGPLFPTDDALRTLTELFERVGSRPGIHR